MTGNIAPLSYRAQLLREQLAGIKQAAFVPPSAAPPGSLPIVRSKRGARTGHAPTNVHDADDAQVIILLTVLGCSIRQVARAVGVAKNTVIRYKRLFVDVEDIRPCECGQPASHKGWCSSRYSHSEARQKTMIFMQVNRALKSHPETFFQLPSGEWGLTEWHKDRPQFKRHRAIV